LSSSLLTDSSFSAVSVSRLVIHIIGDI
jgi:hypothetical protein